MACGDRVYVESVTRGHHVYNAPMIGEYLEVCREPENLHDRRAVCIKKGGVIVGHVPCELTAILVKFIDHGGAISCMQGARETTTRKRIRSSVFLFISRKEETINCNAKVYLSTPHISIE